MSEPPSPTPRVISARRPGAPPPPRGGPALRPLPPALRREALSALGRLLASGRSLPEALSDLQDAARDPGLAADLQSLREGIREGLTLAQAAARAPRLLGPRLAGTIQAGEATGRLPDVLARLADALARREAAGRSLLRAAAYPVLLLALAALLLPLPCLSAGCGPAGYAMQAGRNLALLGVLLAATAGLPRLLRAAGLASGAAALASRLPGPRWVLHPRDRADVLHALSACLSAGLGLPATLSLAAGATSDPALADACRRAARRVERGSGLAQALDAEGLLPPADLLAVTGAEGSGDLPDVLARLGDQSLEAHARRLDLALRGAGRALLVAVLLFLASRLLSSDAAVPGLPDDVLRQLEREIPGLFQPLR